MLGITCRKSDLVLVILLTAAGATHAADISILSEMDTLRADFAKPEIPVNEALITQSSNSNSATIDQQGAAVGAGNYTEINQNGSFNQASMIQTGDSNRARVDQTGYYNSANATQSGSHNSLDLIQVGSGNSIDLAQTGDANLFQANQTGDNNSIVATQNGTPATVVEGGNNNSVTVNLNSSAPHVGISIVGNGMTVSVH